VRRTIVESLYLLTAPVTAVAGLLLAFGGLGLGTVGLLLPRRWPGRSSVVAAGLAPARWSGDLEWWRIGRVRSLAGAPGAGQRTRPGETAASDPGLWLDVAHAVVVIPVVLATSVVTALWWFLGLASTTSFLRFPDTSGSSPPLTLSTGSTHAPSYIAVSLGLRTPTGHLVFGTTVGVLLLFTLPLMTRACVAVQARLGQALLSDASALHRRIRGLEQERDTARAQTVAAVTAEATALRRLERDIHDGPQQRLVRLAMELGRAQHLFDSRPEAVREALADAIAQTHEALEELRALSRGIAPPVLVDRGLREALSALAALSTVPVELDAGSLDRRLGRA